MERSCDIFYKFSPLLVDFNLFFLQNRFDFFNLFLFRKLKDSKRMICKHLKISTRNDSSDRSISPGSSIVPICISTEEIGNADRKRRQQIRLTRMNIQYTYFTRNISRPGVKNLIILKLLNYPPCLLYPPASLSTRSSFSSAKKGSKTRWNRELLLLFQPLMIETINRFRPIFPNKFNDFRSSQRLCLYFPFIIE